MDFQAYSVSVRLSAKDELSRVLFEANKGAMALHKNLQLITKDLRIATSSVDLLGAAFGRMYQASQAPFTKATRQASDFAQHMKTAADSTRATANAMADIQRMSANTASSQPGVSRGKLETYNSALLGFAGAAVGAGGGRRGGGGFPILPPLGGRDNPLNGWNNGVPPGGWGAGGGNGGGGSSNSGMGLRDSGMTNLATGYLGFEFFNSIAEKGTSYERELARLRQMGLSDAQLIDVKKYVDTYDVANTSRLDRMRIFTDAQGSFRESGMPDKKALEAAEIMMPILAKYEVASAALSDSSKAAAGYNMRNLNKIVEIMGGLSDTKRAAEIADAVFKASQASGRLVDENQLKQFVAYGSSATNHQGIRAIMGGLEPIIAEMGGSTTAVGLRTAYTRVNGMMSLPPKLMLHEMQRLGMTDATGRKQTDKLHELEATDIVGYATEIMRLYKAHGITKSTDIERENAIIFGTNGAKILNRVMAQMDTIQKSLQAYDASRGAGQTAGDPNNHVIMARQALAKAYENLELSLAQKGGVLEKFTRGIDALSNGMVKITNAMDSHPNITKYLADTGMIITALAGVSGGMWVLKHAADAIIKPLGLVGRGVQLLTAADSMPALATAIGGLPAVVAGAITAITAYAAYSVYDWYKNGNIDATFKQTTSEASKGGSWFNPTANSNALADYRHLINPTKYPVTTPKVFALPNYAEQNKDNGRSRFIAPMRQPDINVKVDSVMDGRKVGEGVTKYMANQAVKAIRQSTTQYDPLMTPPTVATGR